MIFFLVKKKIKKSAVSSLVSRICYSQETEKCQSPYTMFLHFVSEIKEQSWS